MLDLKAWIEKVTKALNKGFFYANGSTATTITATSTPTKLPITSISAAAKGFSYDSTNKGIKCNKTGVYLISASLDQTGANSGDLWGIQIYRNGTSIIGPAYDRLGGNYDGVELAPTNATLNAGDVLTVYFRNNTGARGTSGGLRFSAWEV